MSSITESARADTATPLRDRRSFWRILLAVVTTMPMLAKGTFYILSPAEGDATFNQTVTAFEAHRDLLEPMKLLDAVFVVTLIPATIGVSWVARRGAPRLATAGAFIALTGFFAGIALLGGVETPALVTVQKDLDPTTMSALSDAMETDPLLGVASLLFIIGVVFGLGLLGGALKRSRAVPTWAAFAVMLGGATHPFIPTSVGQGVGLLVAALGFIAVSLSLLRMSDEEFDLPPRGAPEPTPGNQEVR